MSGETTITFFIRYVNIKYSKKNFIFAQTNLFIRREKISGNQILFAAHTLKS
jgi:hypothetical protein